MAAAVDDLSGGRRLTLGLGAGWQEREHQKFGFDLLDTPERFKRFEEGLEVATQLLRSNDPVDFNGEYFNLNEALLLPRPKRPGGPPILIGGNGPKRTLPLAAKYATEWNSIYLPADQLAALNQQLDVELEKQGRKPESMKRSMMAGCEFGRDDKEVIELVKTRTEGKLTPEELAAKGLAVGTTNQIVDQLGAWAEAGLQRIMLQWLALDDIDRLAAMGQELLPQLK
jgi:alkanesulfonate monooxygenase SsuD/methylene tetrahydromethanopterin reductase-like flavin-dependent oxidoreductase (luciferase family)